MKCPKPIACLTEAEFRPVHDEYVILVEWLRKRWLRGNNRRPNIWVLHEIDPQERERVNGVIWAWGQYITPLAEEWWRRRGVGIRWPKEPDGPCEFYQLETEVQAA